MTYSLNSLPAEVLNLLKVTRIVSNSVEYRQQVLNSHLNGSDGDLFSVLLDNEPDNVLKVSETPVIWATDTYVDYGEGYQFSDAIEDVSLIVPRVKKTKDEQQRRAKGKAEVFTPAWLCNKMNNMVDDSAVYRNAFNISSDDFKQWTATSGSVKFPEKEDWLSYVINRRLEITCGEAPYLVSRYDMSSGTEIPVRDTDGNFTRIGLLDRKFRVVFENTATDDDWLSAALLAVSSIYGYEWQGDSLLLARLNVMNTFCDYYFDKFSATVPNDLLVDVAKIVSWNLWQMDGLNMVSPLSCSVNCHSCLKKLRTNHNGTLPVVRFLENDGSYSFHSFEKFMLKS